MQKIFFPSSSPRFINPAEVIEGLKKIAKRLAKKNKKVEAVYLFGSYAQGNAGFRSDADIMVVLSRDKRKAMDRLDEFILEFSDGPVPIDVLTFTRAEIEQGLRENNQFLAAAMRGIKLC